VGHRWKLMFKTITAFTVAHSITLAAATLGWVHVAAEPLSAVIALSILFLGVEVARLMRGGTSFTIEHPWVAAFGFGLVHGIGFASGLSTLGLPAHEIVAALLFFNIGVEIGQLAFVAAYLMFVRAVQVLEVKTPSWAEALPAYVIGTLGAYWTIVYTAKFF
jgi:HupE / UreJ protein